MAKRRDKTEIPPITPYRRARRDKARTQPKAMRVLEVEPAINGEYFWRCKGENGETVYTSETFVTKTGAKESAAREHEGRQGRYGYVLKWTDERSGKIMRETL
ncbi:hypothetical protein KHO57_gp125 [Mycobacterium phage Phabba]|uniref:DUF1508 domain-containing protein n=1 Tax=Mycobacterium phage Phabba TaxID=2027899 RepID=A0A249XSR7_9CAUD|nr:hypothetical protein KHO57_gp125 [Mycobacterium phage Phabba]ASZ74779.1 hypothetical protein SEA_PHABBA_242 [Mycobacterium phage Phabba]